MKPKKTVTLVVLILSLTAWLRSSPARAEPDATKIRADQIQKVLTSGDMKEKRHAVLALTMNKGNENQIVDAVVCDHVQCYLAIRQTAKAGTKRLFFRLVDPSNRTRSLDGIAVLTPEDLAQGNLLESLQKEAAKDKELQLVVRLLKSIVAGNDSDKDLMSELAKAKWDSDIAAMYRVAVTFKGTRNWAVPMVRDRLKLAILHLDEEGMDNEVGDLVVCLLFAASSGPLDDADIALMREACDKFETLLFHGEKAPFGPAVFWAQWLGCGRKTSDLHRALRCSGTENPPYETRFLYSFNEILGDRLLRATDIPLLIAQTDNEKSDDHVKVGAIRILSFLGPTDQSVHNIFLKFINADQESIRLAVAEGIGRCVEKKTKNGRLLAAVEGQLQKETSIHIRTALQNAKKLLERAAPEIETASGPVWGGTKIAFCE